MLPVAIEYPLWMEQVERIQTLRQSPILSLGDIVKEFDLMGYTSLKDRIHQVDTTCDTLKGSHEIASMDFFKDVCRDACRYCASAKFGHSSAKALVLLMRLDKLPWQYDASAVQAAFRSLEDDISFDMVQHTFIHVEEDHAKYLDAKKIFGEKVALAFPSASNDSLEAGNCIAVELGTAAVFHLMRVVECGMLALAVDLGLLEVTAGKNKTTPIEYAQWEQILQQLSAKIDSRIETIPRGQARQEAQEFYYSAHKEIGHFKVAWRNHVMHGRSTYTYEDAIAVLSHVERFMKSLAEFGIGELIQ